MWTKKLAAMFLAAVMVFSAATPAFAENDSEWEEIYTKIEKSHNGYIIENNVIFASGVGSGPKGATRNGSFYKSFARQAARFDALRRLAELANGVQVEATVDRDEAGNPIWETETVITSLETNEKIMEILSKSSLLGEAKFFDDGVCVLIMKMPLLQKD